ncbi:hypothetical protein [Methylocucumis oryzae]|uniref:hypothetical protein n=1 Tax=Methylocucumis oryzae TaxID=1632867 RepID=UPI0023BAD935|nr:hypothetical protein [Methylocucumis oryzae]
MPKDNAAANLVPDAHDKDKHHAPIMLTTDLALKTDPSYEKIAKTFPRKSRRIRAGFC